MEYLECAVCHKTVPSNMTQRAMTAGGRRVCTDCSGQRPSFVRAATTYATTVATPAWFDAIGIVHFDLQLGQVLQYLYPPLPFSSQQDAEIAFLCFPDANFAEDGDAMHDFVYAYNESECDPEGSRLVCRHASDLRPGEQTTEDRHSGSPMKKPNIGCSAIELFGTALFRQKKDASIRRGAQQRALVVLSRYALPRLSHYVLETLCDAIFDAAMTDIDIEAVLRSAYTDILSWPKPRPDMTYPCLPFLGATLATSTPGYDPQDIVSCRWSCARHTAHDFLGTISQLRAMLSLETPSQPALRRIVEAISKLNAVTAHRVKRVAESQRWWCDDLIHYTAEDVHSLRRAAWALPDDRMASSQNVPPRLKSADDHELAECLKLFRMTFEQQIAIDALQLKNEALLELLSRVDSSLQCHVSPLMAACSGAETPSTVASSDHAPHSLEAIDCSTPPVSRSRASSAMEPSTGAPISPTSPNLAVSAFAAPLSEISLHGSLFPHLTKLYKLWELIIIGAPVVVLGSSVPLVSAACLALCSLCEPLHFVGFLRPYITINTREIEDAAGKTPTGPSIVGCTNPFFSRLFEAWPHILAIGDSREPSETHKTFPHDSPKRAKLQFKLKNRLFCSRHYFIKTDKAEVPGITIPPQLPKTSKGSISFVSTMVNHGPLSAAVGAGGVEASSPSSSLDGFASPTLEGTVAPAPALPPPARRRSIKGLFSSSSSAAATSTTAAGSSASLSLDGHLRAVFIQLTLEFLEPVQRFVVGVLRKHQPYFTSDADDAYGWHDKLLGRHALVEGLRSLNPVSLQRYKSIAEGLQMYDAFFSTPTFARWLRRLVSSEKRRLLLEDVESLEDVLVLCPSVADRPLVLDSLQQELEQQLQRPLLDTALLSKLASFAPAIVETRNAFIQAMPRVTAK